MNARQLALDLGHRPALGAEDFLVAPCNEAAVAWIDRWPAWPAPALVVHGPSGCGKSHLASVWQARSAAHAMAADAARAESLEVSASPAILVEDADAGLDEEAFLHLYNVVAARRGSLMLTARTPPARWAIGLPDLRSRLVAAPAIAILPPDDALLAAVLRKLFRDRQLPVADEVITYLVTRMERSFDAARRLVAALDAAALSESRAVTVPLVRSVLERSGSGSAVHR